VPQAAALAGAALDLALKSNSPNLLAHARLRVAHVFNELDQPKQAAELAQLVIATEHLSPRFRTEARLAHAQALLCLGNVDAAQAAAADCYELNDGGDRNVARGLALRILAQCASACGRRDKAAHLFSRSLEALESGGHARALYFAQRAATVVLNP
jgi:ATP/maltotriose-dependent transcriptional regulator MalT